MTEEPGPLQMKEGNSWTRRVRV